MKHTFATKIRLYINDTLILKKREKKSQFPGYDFMELRVDYI